jgi:hypothetical protein
VLTRPRGLAGGAALPLSAVELAVVGLVEAGGVGSDPGRGRLLGAAGPRVAPGRSAEAPGGPAATMVGVAVGADGDEAAGGTRLRQNK